ncbi:MAG: BON domain-containing protein [Oscillochloris sp.]|nr:BON domain-containing protein [Oscillochloris sp.]
MEDERTYREDDDYGRSRGHGARRDSDDQTAEQVDRAQRRSSRGMGNYGPDDGQRPDYPQGLDQRDNDDHWRRSASYGPQRDRSLRGEPDDFGQGTGGYGNQSGFGNARGRSGAVAEELGIGGQGWMGDGPHAGRGPKGYRRSDERIMEDVCERLTRHGDVDASQIEVIVNDGEVTLSGFIDNRRNKRTAEAILDDINGIRDVHNQLRIRRNDEDQ